jgi:hypothetical protein
MHVVLLDDWFTLSFQTFRFAALFRITDIHHSHIKVEMLYFYVFRCGLQQIFSVNECNRMLKYNIQYI